MSLPDEDLMRQIPEEYEGDDYCICISNSNLCALLNVTGSPDELLKELKSLVELLVHLEPSIVRTLATKPQVKGLLQYVISIYCNNPSTIQRSLTKYLKKLQVCDTDSKLLSAIPAGILLEHYVSLRLFLRRYINMRL